MITAIAIIDRPSTTGIAGVVSLPAKEPYVRVGQYPTADRVVFCVIE